MFAQPTNPETPFAEARFGTTSFINTSTANVKLMRRQTQFTNTTFDNTTHANTHFTNLFRSAKARLPNWIEHGLLKLSLHTLNLLNPSQRKATRYLNL